MAKAKKQAKPAAVVFATPPGITKILALDLSLNSTGWATCDLRNDAAVWGALVNPPEGKAGHREGLPRLHWIAEEITKLLGGTPLSKVYVVIENFSFGSANKAAEIGMLHGVVRYMLFRAGVANVMIAPTQMKKWVVGKGVAEKSLILKYIEKRYGYDCDQEDAADALGLMTLARALLGHHPGTLVAFQKEVLAQIMNGK